MIFGHRGVTRLELPIIRQKVFVPSNIQLLLYWNDLIGCVGSCPDLKGSYDVW